MSTTLEAALAEATASRAPVQRKLHTTQAEYAAARADLEARARAGETVQGRDNRGCFTKGVKVFTAGKAPTAPARKVAKVEAPRPAPRVHVPASAALSAEV